MHFEVPKGGLKTVKEFLGEYAMIVVSILTALALEHAAQSWHHRHRAQEAEQKIEEELRGNLAELRSVTEANRMQLEKLHRMRVVLRDDIKAKAGDKEIVAHLMTESNQNFGLNLKTPTMRREAWDVAVASQAASWMSPALLQRYSALYAQQRETQASVLANTQLSLSGPAMQNTLSDIDLGRLDATALYHTIRQMESTISGVQNNLVELEKQMKTALAKG